MAAAGIPVKRGEVSAMDGPCPNCAPARLARQRRCPSCGRSLLNEPRPGTAARPVAVEPGLLLRSARALRDDASQWCRGRSAWWRLPFLVWMTWLAVQWTGNRASGSLFDGINLGIHEGGHLLFRSFGELLHVLGGTLLQLIVPLSAGAVLARQRDWFGLAVILTWLASNWFYIAVYMADARALAMPLVTVGGGGAARRPEEVHDWSILFRRWGVLEQDTTIALFPQALGLICAWAGVALGAWLCWRMLRPVPNASY